MATLSFGEVSGDSNSYPYSWAASILDPLSHLPRLFLDVLNEWSHLLLSGPGGA